MSTDSLQRSVDLLARILECREQRSLQEHAATLGLPVSTAHRLFAALAEVGLIHRERRGRYCAGPRLVELLYAIDRDEALARLCRPLLHDLAQRTQCAVHLGVLRQSMVTYLVRIGGTGLFTREGTQLEAYCTGIGKVLLAGLNREELDSYLSEGPFVPLTARTKTQPEAIRRELSRVRQRGYALDLEEIKEGLGCVSTPIRNVHGDICAALSLASSISDIRVSRKKLLAPLQACAARIEREIVPRYKSNPPRNRRSRT